MTTHHAPAIAAPQIARFRAYYGMTVAHPVAAYGITVDEIRGRLGVTALSGSQQPLHVVIQ
jgi:hypothetical protein